MPLAARARRVGDRGQASAHVRQGHVRGQSQRRAVAWSWPATPGRPAAVRPALANQDPRRRPRDRRGGGSEVLDDVRPGGGWSQPIFPRVRRWFREPGWSGRDASALPRGVRCLWTDARLEL